MSVAVSSGNSPYTISNGQTDVGDSIVSGGSVFVEAGGTASNTTVSSGGLEVISAGGNDFGAQISGGEQDVSGFASGATIFTGSQTVVNGGFALATTISSGGLEIVSSGGNDDSVQISGGEQDVFGTAGFGQVFGGAQVVEAGGTASSTTLWNGSEIISSGGTDSAGSIWGGEQDVYGAALGVGIYVGSQVVESGGTASGTTINDFSSQFVGNGGSASDTTISNGGFEYVESGGSASVTSITSGGTEIVLAGGTATSAVVFSGGTLYVLPGGIALDIINSGGTVSSGVVPSGQTDIGDIVSSGNTEIIESGGTASSTIVSSGGLEIVSGGGNDFGALISGGEQDVYGYASGATVFTGSQVVEDGGSTEATTISSGGFEIVSSGGSDNGVSVSGGTEDVSGLATFGQIFTGSQFVESGGTASGMTIWGGAEIVHSGGTDFETSIWGGEQDVFGSAFGVNIFVGSQVVESGGAASGTTINDFSSQFVGNSGSASATTISNGGFQYVESGGTASVTSITSGGTEVVSAGGTAISAVVFSGGTLDVLAGGAALDIVNSGGTVNSSSALVVSAGNSPWIVSSGQTDIGDAIISGGIETVSSDGTTSSASVFSGGTLNVAVGGVASGAILYSGGLEVVGSGGTDASVQISGGEQDVYGRAINATVDAGVQVVESGGTTTATTVNDGGTQQVAGGTANSTTVTVGGTQSVQSSGAASGTTIDAGGTQVISAGGLTRGAIVYGFGTASGLEVVSSGGTASGTNVSSGGVLELVGGATASGFNINSGGKLEIASGYVLSGYGVKSGSTLVVASGGIAAGTTTVSFGGMLELLGGATVSSLIGNGGTVEVASGYVLSGYQVSGSTVLVSGGAVLNTTIDAGGFEAVYAGGTDTGAQIDGGEQVLSSGGTAVSATVSNAQQYVYSGGTANATTVVQAGFLDVQGGTANDAIVSSGGTVELFNGSLGSAFVFAGGTLDIRTNSMPSAVISGFAPGDIIDLESVGFAGGSATLSAGNELQIVIGGASYDLQFDPSQDFTGYSFDVLPDQFGTTEVILANNVGPGQTVSGGTVTSGNVEVVYGTAIDTTVEDGGTLIVASGGVASSTTVEDGGVVKLLGGAEISGATALTSSATIGVSGTVDNQDGTINIGAGQLYLYGNGAVISGGTIEDDGSGSITGAGTLDGVTLEGALAFTLQNHQLPDISVKDGITFEGPNGAGPATFSLSGQFYVFGSTDLDNAVIDSTGNLFNEDPNGSGAVLTLGPQLTFNAIGSGTLSSQQNNSGDGIVNEGTINIDLARKFDNFNISVENFTNAGTIAITTGQLDAFPLFFTNAATGLIRVGSTGTLSLDGFNLVNTQWSNQGQIVLSGGTLDLGGTFAASSLAGISENGGGEVNIDARIMLGGQTLTLGPSTLAYGNEPALTGVAVQSGTVISGTGTISGSVTSAEALIADGGTMVVDGGVSHAGLTIDGNSNLVISGAVASSTVTFNGTSGTLTLETAASFAGTIADLAPGDTIDLVNTRVDSATISGSILTIDESNGGVLNYALSGPGGYAVEIADDGLGGSNLIIQKGAPYNDLFNAANALVVDLNDNASLSQISADGLTVYIATIAGAIGTLGGTNWQAAYQGSSEAAAIVSSDLGDAANSATLLQDTLSLYDTIVAGALGSIASGASQTTSANIAQAAGGLAADIVAGATAALQSDVQNLYAQLAGGDLGNSQWQQALAASEAAAATLAADQSNGAASAQIQSDVARLYGSMLSGSLNAIGGSSLQGAYDSSGKTIETIASDISGGVASLQIQSDVAGLYNAVIGGVDGSSTALALQDYQSAMSAAEGLRSDLGTGASEGQIWADVAAILTTSLSGQVGAVAGTAAEQYQLNLASALHELAVDSQNGLPSGEVIQTLGATAAANLVGLILGSQAQIAYSNAADAAQTLYTDLTSAGTATTQVAGDTLALLGNALAEYDVINGGASAQAYASIVQASQTFNADIESGDAGAIEGDITALINATNAGDVDAIGSAAVWSNMSQSESTLVADIQNGADSNQILTDAGTLYDNLTNDSTALVGTPDPQLAINEVSPSVVVANVITNDQSSILGNALSLVAALADPCPGMGKPKSLLDLLNDSLQAWGFQDTLGTLLNKLAAQEVFPATLSGLMEQQAINGLKGLTSTGAQFAAEAGALAAQEGLAAALDGPLFGAALFNLWFDANEAGYKLTGHQDDWDFFIHDTDLGKLLNGIHDFTKLLDPTYYIKYLADSWSTIAWGQSTPTAKFHDDTHLTTYDGQLYDLQAAGEFILTQSRVPGDTFAIQGRMEPWSLTGSTSTTVSVTTMIGAAVGSDRVTFAIDRPDLVWVDGNPVTLTPGTVITLGGGRITELTPYSYQVNWNTGESMTVTSEDGLYLNASVSLSAVDGPETVQGLLGPNDGAANDFELPDGTVLPQPLTTAQLYGEFADAWRVTQQDSLLDYASGQTTATFTDVDFPGDGLTLADLPQDLVNEAAQLAAAAGITDPNLAAEAELDYIATGNLNFITDAAAVQVPGGSTVAQVTPSSPPPALLGLAADVPAVVESTTGSTPVTFEVYLTSASATDTAVNYAVVSGGAGYFDAAQFGGTLPSGAVTISAGQTTAQFTIDVPENALGTEPLENLEVQITKPAGVGTLATTADTVVINNQPEPGAPAVPSLEYVGTLGTFTQSGNDYTLDLGTLPFGDMPDLEFAIVNAADRPADDLSGGFAVTAGSGVTWSGTTTFAALAPGQAYNELAATPDSGILGSSSETLTFTPQELNASGYSGVLPDINLTINYTLVLAADAVINSPTMIHFGNARTGTPESQFVSVTNSANAGAANLDAFLTLAGDAIGSGAIFGLAPGAIDDTSLVVGLNTNTAGVESGLASVNFTSDAGGGNTNFFESDAVELSGSVYRPATASTALPVILHVGDPVAQALAISNIDPADGYSEDLIANVVGSAGGVTVTGTTTGEIAPQATSNAISLGFSTAAAADIGTVTLDFVTDGGTGSGSIDGLGTKDLGDKTVSVTVDNYAQAAFEEVSGGGSFTDNGGAYTLDLGTVIGGGGPLTLEFGVVNGAVGPADLLSGAFSVSGDSAFTNSGFNVLSGLAAGEVNSALTVVLDTNTNGSFSETITFDPTDYNAAGYSSALAPETLTISATVEVPNPIYVSSGHSVSGVVVSGGYVFDVLSGGNATGTAIDSGGSAIVESGGRAHDTTVLSGAALTVSNGGAADPTTIYAGGSETVSAGGNDDGALISGGTQYVYGSASDATVFAGGLQVVESGGAVSDTIVSGGTVEVVSGGTVHHSITFTGSGGTLQIDGLGAAGNLLPGATVSGFAAGDTIDLTGVAYGTPNSVGLAGGDELQLTLGGATYDLQLAGNFIGDYFHLMPDNNGAGLGTDIIENTTPCYCPGTLIRTERGQKKVEELKVGDHVVTASGALRPIKWIGRRSYGGHFIIGRKDILPICIQAGALDENVPQRDLWISPHHAMFLEGVLIEAKDLVNGVSIVQADNVDRVTYVHIELDAHDVIIAEGALSETFVDDDSRGMFHNAHEFHELYPNATPLPARYCAPRREDGYEVAMARRRIAQRAGLGPQTEQTSAGGLRGFVDLISPTRIAGWAQNICHPEAAVCLDIYICGQLVGQTLADRHREDLQQAGLGRGCHSFEFTPPVGLAFSVDEVQIVRALDGSPLTQLHLARTNEKKQTSSCLTSDRVHLWSRCRHNPAASR